MFVQNLVQETIEVFSEVVFCCILIVFCSRLELKNDAMFLKGNTANAVFFLMPRVGSYLVAKVQTGRLQHVCFFSCRRCKGWVFLSGFPG